MLDNGGDGLVAARHLSHFGYKPTILYPKQTDKPLYHGLATQCKSLNIPFIDELPSQLDDSFQLLVDAIFGFSFSGSIRAPFDKIITSVNNSKLPVVAVDIPSGWNVEEGKENENYTKLTLNRKYGRSRTQKHRNASFVDSSENVRKEV